MSAYKDGLAPDPRTEEQKAKDFKHSDRAGNIILNWRKKPKSEWKTYTPREQDGSLSCCGQSGAKAFEILLHDVFSAHPIYRSRSNFPDGGMYLQNLGEAMKKVGTTTEILDPSQVMNETQMNRPITVPTPNKIGGYFFVNSKKIEEIAEAIELYGHCILIVHCNKSEWTSKPTYNGSEVNFGHCYIGTDYFIDDDGDQVILSEDSTGHFNSLTPEKIGQRLLTSDFLVKRTDGAMYVTTKYIFTKLLKYGMKGEDVKELQKALKIVADGIFGFKTLNAVKTFQFAHNLKVDGVVGPKCNAILNTL